MPYKVGDIVEVTRAGSGSTGFHGFKKGDQVRVAAALSVGTPSEHYKCDSTGDGKRESWYVGKKDLVKRRKK